METIQSIVLGVVQGLGEFLPISSTAHLVLVPFFTGWEDPGLAFDVALHAGTLLAVLAYFWKDWIVISQLTLGSVSKLKIENSKSALDEENSDFEKEYPNDILWLLIAATIPGVLAGYFLEDLAGSVFRNPWMIVFTLSFFGFLLYLFDKYMKQRKNIGNIGFKEAIIIGLSQAIAIIPGVSRSGVTITASRALGLDRVSSARFSFLLSTPIIFGATVKQFPYILNNGVDGSLIWGVVVSAVSGYLAIKYLIKFVQKSSYKIFFWYRLVLASIIVLFIYIG
ncbi:MAG: undecaprenyl-diphosphate phosphatase [Candidatus Moranbacteria bacterium]|jgi:undecaprenyl-diphosphatase|nr:undecaprenyl-diphosphate phosphatase [Candidatus Moranbacteria bacterium]MDD5652051.1 undecaprenyl-diphosphate phosphatase [Candidatus Moranbacteria bacterium]MDX9855362.1 undecaprenyl-diphosphate phosphatase [Candidatus Moranbacteria bacterium]